MDQTVPLVDLFDKEFNIPHYQRGYRWEEQEVRELLNDLWDFSKPTSKGIFYCLQPIVVQQKGDNIYDVLDGQQRLTTLYLILMFLEERRLEDYYNSQLFKLKYQTRADSQEFLEKKKFKNAIDESNIDFYHMRSSYQIIEKWFSEHPGAKGKILQILMDNNDDGNRNVRFIWYEVENDDSVNPIEIFIRLNVGKIPLTDAELIKALLLQSDAYENKAFVKMKLFEIATEWDSIEYALQKESFWFFLNNGSNSKTTHIEFIFDLIAAKMNKEKKYFEKTPKKHATFLILSAYLEDLLSINNDREAAVKTIWEEVSSYFEYFKDWYDDRILYHYIGFIITQKGSAVIDPLIIMSSQMTKTDFKSYLASEIYDIIKINKKRKDRNGNLYKVKLKDLSYENEDQKSNDINEIHKILLIHNIHTTLKSNKESARFPFNLYKKTKLNEKWSLEHIHAQNSQNITNIDHQKTWLKDHVKSLKNIGTSSAKKIFPNLMKLEKQEVIEFEMFDTIVKTVYTFFNALSGFNDSNKHTIDNLCLIDQPTNSLLNNSVFDVKREKIKQREVDGYYIPICTRNLFLKAYTSFPQNNAYWTQEDRTAYLKDIKKTYNFFNSFSHTQISE
jgi:uncharacterized protein with ParB-like and HNH nuclease domain